ncbi:hypothetical protein [Variovorax sp. OV329]|uniref:hypothetical protein n=1 Tax=Variovorax sp. OV329 TaxID=1882825 RepID=UPI0008F3F81A|nr:hypothetical protein [Variovorax sp. OV329]SFM07380.1 hypothetical protein SAMN05444747_102291 [Variovorax sp. OV329]
MTPFALANHVANFAAPALFLALVLGLGGRLILGKGAALGLLAQMAINFATGVAVLAGGMVYFGRDGMMATYVALVLVCGTLQWLLGGGLRR